MKQQEKSLIRNPDAATMKDWALWYASQGMAVFPLHTNSGGGCSCGQDCNSPAKHPRTMNGVKDATTDPAQIREWWRMWPDSNIGLATGSTSGIAVLDIDNDNEKGVWGDDSLRLWEGEQGELPPTWTSLTGGGGVHYLFRIPDGIRIGNRTHMLEGMDCRGEGGYIVAPPSIHISGRRYTWDAMGDPADTPLASLPDALYRLMCGHTGDGGQRFELPAQIAAGARNDTLFRLACSLRARGLSEAAIYAAVMEENITRCNPPLSERETRTICSSAAKYAPGDFIEVIEADAQTLTQVAQSVQERSYEEITSREMMQTIFAIKDMYERQRLIDQLRTRAAELKRKRDFDQILSTYRRQYIAKRSANAAQPVKITDCPVPGLRCANWDVSDDGVRRVTIDAKGGEFEEVASSQPIIIASRLKNIDTAQEKVRLLYLDLKTGNWEEMVVPKTTIANRTKIVELSGAGVDVTSESAKYLVNYLNDLETASTEAIPSYRSIGRLGWLSDGTFSPYMDDVKFDGLAQYKDLFEATTPSGDPGEWARTALQLRGESVFARAALAGSFASPMVGYLQKLPFFLHLWGGSESGKTVAMMVAMSVWGNPALGKLIRSFDGTAVGQERLAAFMHSVPLALDELQTIRKAGPMGTDFDQIIYKLGEGQGRLRGTRDGGVEQISYWRLCILSTGEEPITTFRSGGGAKNRVLEVYCHSKIFKDAPAAAGFAQSCYGHAGRVFVEGLRQDGVRDRAADLYDNWYRWFCEDNGKMEKQSMAAAMLCAADELSSRIVFGQDAPDTQRFAEGLLDLMADSEDIDITERAWEYVCGWIAANQSRFAPNAAEKGECYGKQTKPGEYYVISTILNDMLQSAGFSPRRCLSAFAEQGRVQVWLVERKDGTTTTRFTDKATVGNTRPRCVLVKLGADSEDSLVSPAPFF